MMKRLRFILVVFVLIMVAVLVRVVMLQTIQRDGYLEASINQRTRLTTVRAPRGVIFDRTGQELALSVPRTTLFADPRQSGSRCLSCCVVAVVSGKT